MNKGNKNSETDEVKNRIPNEQDIPAEDTAQPPEAGGQPTEDVKLSEELNDLKARYIRLAAEYDNYRKRTARERESIYGDAIILAAAAFLPVLDNLERAANQTTEDLSYKKGVELTLKVLNDSLSKLKIEEIPALGQPFNPELHHAVLHIEDETCGDNAVVEVLQKGFLLDGRVIRHAMVKVAN